VTQNLLAIKLEWLRWYAQNGFLIHAHHYRKANGTCSCIDVPWNETRSCTYEAGGHPVRKYREITEVSTAFTQTRDQLQRDPGYNFALRTGGCSGVVAIDVDVKDGKNGLQSLDDLIRRLGLSFDDFALTPHAITGSGGYHFLFQTPQDGGEAIANSQSALAEHIDVRGENGYILVAPSLHKRTGRPYVWQVQPFRQALRPLPPALLAEIRRSQGASSSAYTTRVITAPPTEQEFRNWAKSLKGRAKTRQTGEVLLAALQGEALPFPKGTGNESLFKLAIDVAQGWPSNRAAGLAELLRESIEKRQEQLGGTTTVEEFAQLINTEQEKLHRERTGENSKWRYGDRDMPGYKRDEKGVIQKTLWNFALPLRQHPQWRDVLGYDVRTHKVYFTKPPPIDLGVDDSSFPLEAANTEPLIHDWLERHEHMSVELKNISDAMIVAARQKPFNPVREWLESLPAWDGMDRISSLLQRIGGVEASDWAQVAQRRWFTALIARMLEPGCKVDNMLILQGKQGFKKSSFFRTLMPYPEWFSDSLRTPDLAEGTIRQLHSGPVIFEIAEMQGFRRDAISNIKAFLAASSDQFRPLYGKHATQPRSFVVVGTTNEEHFLHDPTGGRRFWPLRVQKRIRINQLREEREQLFAQALYQYRQGEQWYLTFEEDALAEAVQAEHYEPHHWHDLVADWLANRIPSDKPPIATSEASPDYVDLNMIFHHVLKMEPKERANIAYTNTLKNILRQEGWLENVRPRNVPGRKRMWQRPGIAPSRGGRPRKG